MVFWYNMNGNSKLSQVIYKIIFIKTIAMGTLNVYAEVKQGYEATVKNKLWSLSRQQGNLWHIARVPANYNTDFRFIFEGTKLKFTKTNNSLIISF